MLNHITDAKRVEALSLVREGRMYDLGRVLDEHVPVFPDYGACVRVPDARRDLTIAARAGTPPAACPVTNLGQAAGIRSAG